MSIFVMDRTENEIERAITHRDLDWELARAARYRYLQDQGRVRRVKQIEGGTSNMSLTGTYAELVYANRFVYTAKNTFTTEFNIADTATGNALFTLPAEFFTPGSMAGKGFRIVARGVQLGTGSTPPTWLWSFRFNPTLVPAVPPTGPIIGGGPAGITGTVNANALWEAEFDVRIATEGAAGNNTTMRGQGFVQSPRGLVSPFAMELFGGAASPGTVATFDWSLSNTLTVGMTCGTSLAANQMQLLDLLVMSLN